MQDWRGRMITDNKETSSPSSPFGSENGISFEIHTSILRISLTLFRHNHFCEVKILFLCTIFYALFCLLINLVRFESWTINAFFVDFLMYTVYTHLWSPLIISTHFYFIFIFCSYYWKKQWALITIYKYIGILGDS